MAKPTQAKDPEPKEKDNKEGGGSNNILINIHFFLFKNLCYIVHRNNILIIYFYKYEAG